MFYERKIDKDSTDVSFIIILTLVSLIGIHTRLQAEVNTKKRHTLSRPTVATQVLAQDLKYTIGSFIGIQTKLKAGVNTEGSSLSNP